MVKTLGSGGSGGVQDVKRDEDGMEVMDLVEDEGREMLMQSFCRKILSPKWTGLVIAISYVKSYRQEKTAHIFA